MKPRKSLYTRTFLFPQLTYVNAKITQHFSTNISKQKQHERLDSLSIGLFKEMTKRVLYYCEYCIGYDKSLLQINTLFEGSSHYIYHPAAA